MTIKKLINKIDEIIAAILWHNSTIKSIESYYLDNIDIRELIIYIFKRGNTTKIKYRLFCIYHQLKNLKYQDWILIMLKLSKYSDKMYIIYFIHFTYQYFGINFLNLFFSIDKVSEASKIAVKRTLINKKDETKPCDGLVNFQLDVDTIKLFDLQSSDFEFIRDKLVSEGAKKVTEV